MQFPQFPHLVDVLLGNIRIAPKLDLFVEQVVLVLERKPVLARQFFQFLVERELFLRVIILFLAGPVGLADGFLVFRLGLRHEPSVLFRVFLFQRLHIPKEALILPIHLGDGGGRRIGIRQDALHPLEVGFLLHRVAQFFQSLGGKLGILGDLPQLLLDLDLLNITAGLHEFGEFRIVGR